MDAQTVRDKLQSYYEHFVSPVLPINCCEREQLAVELWQVENNKKTIGFELMKEAKVAEETLSKDKRCFQLTNMLINGSRSDHQSAFDF
jgi:hypothetical protein